MKVFKVLGRIIWIIIAVIAIAVVTCVVLVSVFGTDVKTIKGEESTEEVVPRSQRLLARRRVCYLLARRFGGVVRIRMREHRSLA